MTDRSFRDRGAVSKTAKAAELAAQIAAARQGGGGLKRTEQFHLEAEDKVYDEYDDEDYGKRLAEDDDFIERDGEDGWSDDDLGQEVSDDEDGPRRKKAKAITKKGALSMAPKAKKKPEKAVSAAFLGGRAGAKGPAACGEQIGPSAAGVRRKEDEGADALLASVLGGISAETGASAAGAARGAGRPRSAKDQLMFTGSLNRITRERERTTPASRPAPPAYSTVARERAHVPRTAARAAAEAPLARAGGEPDPSGVDMDMGADDGGAGGHEDMAMDADGPAPPGGAADDVDPAGAADDAVAGAAAKPFSAAPEIGGGEDWFKVCLDADAEEGGGAGSQAEPRSAEPAAATAAGGGASNSMPPLEEDGSLRLYWLDAYEDPYNQPGVLYLFGKVAKHAGGGGGGGGGARQDAFASCCVAVRSLERHIFVLPRDGYEPKDVYPEVAKLMNSHGVKRFKCKPVERKYAFEEEGVPAKGRYLKVAYEAECRPVHAPDGGGNTYSHIFGASTSMVEHLLVKRGVQGPCWLSIEGVAPPPAAVSWCRFEACVSGRKAISVLRADPMPPAPPLRVMSLHVQTVLGTDKARTHQVVLASAIVHDGIELDGADASAALASKPRAGGGGLSHFSVVRKLEGSIWPWDLRTKLGAARGMRVEQTSSERALLSFLLAKVHSLDPDVLVGHNIAGFDVQVLLQRMAALGLQHWSKLCRLKRSKLPRSALAAPAGGRDAWLDWSVVCGRLMVDTYLCSRELLLGQRSYALRELARTQLDVTSKEDIDVATVPARLERSDSLLALVQSVENDAYLALRLMDKLQVLPLTRQLTTIAGNLWAHSLKGQRAERIEYLLLHEFHRLKFIVPDKLSRKEREALAKKKGAQAAAAAAAAGGGAEEDAAIAADADDADDADAGGGGGGGGGGGASTSARRKPAYAGGLVLEPKRGLYDKFVLLLDFNSLYPSIVQEYNLCFTTVSRPRPLEDGSLPPASLPEQGAEPGVLPRLIHSIVAKRKVVKNLLKQTSEPAKLKQLDIRQKALKIMANSMYGCLGFAGSRFFARPIAELICTTGRATLQRTVEIAEGLGLEVIYGDTDSIMIHSRTDALGEAKQMAGALKREVNKLYRCLEIEVDGIFQMMLLLKKKKYAARVVVSEGPPAAPGGAPTIVCERETKGLDLVRRDWCTLSRDVGSAVLDLILSARPREEIVEAVHEYLRTVAASVRANKLPIEAYTITKGLTKAPADYPDAKNQPHVQVALQQIARGESVAAGSIVEYVVCAPQEAAAAAPPPADGADGAAPPPPPPPPAVGKSIAERARHPKVVLEADGGLEIDRDWYLANQIHPPVARLCEPIEGTDSARIAECLGLDPSKFHSAAPGAGGAAADGGEEVYGTAPEDDESRFKDVRPLQLGCAACRAVAPARSVCSAVASRDGSHPSLRCEACGENYDGTALHNAITLAMRAAEKAYYTSALVCEEVSCGERTRCLSAYVSTDENGQPVFPACVAPRCRSRMQPEVSARALHTQLLYLERLFDTELARRRVERARRRKPSEAPAWVTPAKDELAVCHALTAHVRARLRACAFNSVDVGKLCAFAKTASRTGSSAAALGLAVEG